MKKVVLPLVLLTLLTSCHAKPELRKDIKEFIAQFSLSEAMAEYKTGGYTSTKEVTEGENKTKTVVSMEFSIVDDEHPTYVEVTTIYENDVETSKKEVEFVINEEGYFISTNGELQSSSLREFKRIITKFFYKQTQLDGTYHTQGFYYGDYLQEVAPSLQQYVTIDQDNQLYIHEYDVTEKSTHYYQKYLVNKWGMLEENHNTVQNSNKKVQQDIYVHN